MDLKKCLKMCPLCILWIETILSLKINNGMSGEHAFLASQPPAWFDPYASCVFAPLANSISSGSEQYPGRPQSPHYLWRQNRDCCVVTRVGGGVDSVLEVVWKKGSAGQTFPDATPPTGKLHLLQQNRSNIWTNDAILKSFWIWNVLSLCDIVYFFDWKSYPSPKARGVFKN